MANNLHQSRMLGEFIDTVDQNNPIEPPEDDISDFSDEEIAPSEHIDHIDSDKTPRRNLPLRGYRDHLKRGSAVPAKPKKSYTLGTNPSFPGQDI